MNGRVLRTELKRSAAPWAGVTVLGGALAFLCLIDGSWWRGTTRWTAQWTSMALLTRTTLAYLWPLAVGIGALQGLRDSRSRMTELLATAPRPAWRRAALPAGATAIALVSGFGLLVLWGGGQVALGDTTYTPVTWLPIALVGALALVAGAVFGMGVARALPSALTPPALAVICLLATVLLQQHSDEERPSGLAPNRLSQLSPATAEAREMLLTLSGAVHLGQTLWFLGLLATGFALLVAATRRARLLAPVPALAGAALALLVLPAAPRDTYVVDRAAAAPVCDGPVCVTEAHRSRLPELAPHGREALRLLHGVLGDEAPDTVREETALRAITAERELSADVVLADFDDPVLAGARGEGLTRALLAQGLVPNCSARSPRESGGRTELVAQSIAASWALGERDLTPLERYDADDPYAGQAWKEAEAVWDRLTALPPAEQRSRITEARAAALSCDYGQLEALNGGTSR
ncbi:MULTISPECIES: hypothetical protein [Streptomyces]|uniref:Integral membrane protein n=1 Tax=Streptomyces lycii TaxID=2654337 RepID=A0ABQ7F9F4_9ACTN|nr:MULTISPECIES: hypothetical protein [Streptomyces]KAF4405476.1 hypothetical protein GCU69_29980 [Streptomyces lycii]PGH48436.1 hypothetical protein CRI70_23175 [Streptomyces sp. Ru87]